MWEFGALAIKESTSSREAKGMLESFANCVYTPTRKTGYGIFIVRHNHSWFVKSVQEYSAKVEKLGGKIITSKTPVPSVSYLAICQDTENNVFSIFESDSAAK